MVYESNYRPRRNVYDDELMHYGVPGMKWGRRKSPTAYGGSITKSGKYRASNGVVIGRSKNKGAAIGRRMSVSAGGRALAAIGSMSLSSKQKDRMKKEQAALREYYKVGGDKMLKNASNIVSPTKPKLPGNVMGGPEKPKLPGRVMGGPEKPKKPGAVVYASAKKTKADYRRG